jgi:Rne/Rng family ribonuclease
VAAETQALAQGTAPALLLDAPAAADRAFRDWADPAPDAVIEGDDAFERLGVWDAIEALRRPTLALPGGGRMTVEATRAVVAVDVDTAGDFGRNAAATANLAACAELPRQLRLRGLGGVVLIDFAPVKKGARQGIENALKRAFAADPVETTLGGWTPLGHFEIQRKRERRPLADLVAAHG